MTSIQRIPKFLDKFKEIAPVFYPAIQNNFLKNSALFSELGEPLLKWANQLLGENYLESLVRGYIFFVTDVNKSQILYEKTEKYKNSSYQEVYDSTYNNSEHMSLYHWGVFVTTFAWEHHLHLYQFYRDSFLIRIKEAAQNIIEFGSGSGVWGMIGMLQLQDNSKLTGLDISETSVKLAIEMSSLNGFKQNNYIVNDALTYNNKTKYDHAISCFLMEHLEQPSKLLKNIHNNISDSGYAFVTAALTAAEIDHIHEFRRESEVVLMAEEAGFRVISTLSASPKTYPKSGKFLPRSMALILQKKHNEIW